MFRLMRLPDGTALLIRVRDGSVAGRIDAEYVEGVAQVMGVGIPVKAPPLICGECGGRAEEFNPETDPYPLCVKCWNRIMSQGYGAAEVTE